MLRTFLFFLVCSQVVLAAEYKKDDVEITSIRPYSEAELEPSALANYIRIYMPDATWGTPHCRGDAADLKKDDTHLLSVLLAAWASGKKIDMYIDDSIPRVQSTVCRLVNISVY